MAMIAKSLLPLVAPVLTYTADELLEYAPAVIKGDAADVFDLRYEPLPVMAGGFDEAFFKEAREAFFEVVDRLKKEGRIKQTLELAIVGRSEKLQALSCKDVEDWFVVSQILPESDAEVLGTFEVEGKRFSIVRAPGYKCPRCWRYTAPAEEALCERCAKVLNV